MPASLSTSVPMLLHPRAAPATEETQYITIVGGNKATVWDDNGNHYLAARSGASYCNAGWGEPRIIDAVKEQLDPLAVYHVRGTLTNQPAAELAERISSLCDRFWTTVDSDRR
jgi:adenosylmethionine-8-amino-7-oxononanoate aminotransferase